MPSDDIPRFIKEAAEADEALIDAYREAVVVLLLGSAEGDALATREHVQAALTRDGYRVIVMETYPPKKGELLLEKWARILKTEKPTHFFIVVPKDRRMGGAHVELGYLLREYGIRELLDRVLFFFEAGIDPDDALAAYAAELVGRVGVTYYKNRDQVARRVARRIDNILFGTYR